jgi:Tfp pilus assembly protein PilF
MSKAKLKKKAVVALSVATARDPHRDELKRAGKLADEGKHDEAESVWREYLKDCPDDPDVCFNVGVCVMRRSLEIPINSKERAGAHYEAAEFFERVVKNQFAEMERKADAMNNLGLIAERSGETEKAATAYSFALKLHTDHAAAKINLADAHRALGDYDIAASEYASVLDQDPNNPEARMCAGMLALLMGDYERGWDLYRARWRVKTFTTHPLDSRRPRWTGEPLEGKTIMLWEEQGFGDSFNFIRYALPLHRMGARVLFGCQPCLRDVMRGVDGIAEAVERSDATPFDYQIPLLDVPHILGTTTATIPEAHCMSVRHDWTPRFSLIGNPLRKRIALVWAGSPTHGKDKARSITPDLIQPIIDAHPECDFYSLQAGPRAHEFDRLRGATDLAPQIGNWTDTAQILTCMDLLISVDTACVHLAGALGCPVWMLCPNSPDWRWMLGRDDSPYYPKMRLFRQPKADDWKTPIQRINEQLSTF